MIEFHLDGNSGVPAYLQLVQQVRQAIRLGILRNGDQLPTVKEVVATLTINPNTVLHAYRQLDLEGLVDGRRGVGTFVATGSAPPPVDDLKGLRSALDQWVARARAAGLDDEGIRAVLRRLGATRADVAGGGMSTSLAVRTEGLGKRYGATWALRDCTLEIPTGSVTALVGPNGAGKTTLLHLAIGLSRQTCGTVEVLGLSPRDDGKALLPRLGFVAQDHPLYRGLTIAETFQFACKLNPHWDDRYATQRVDHLGLKLGHKVGKLSGGQQAQVALTLALAKQPELLILDEPVASLVPLARREFLNAVMEAVAETGMTVILSSHIVSELERVCDHLVTLADSRTQLAGPYRRDRRKPSPAHRPAERRRERGPSPRRDPGKPHRTADDAARARKRTCL